MKKEYWVTNISNRNVSLADLNLTIKAYSTVNLLDSKHYYYTFDQLEKSRLEGSIYKKYSMIRVRQNAPIIEKFQISTQLKAIIPSRGRSIISIKQEKFDELEIEKTDLHAEDDKYIQEFAEQFNDNESKGTK